MRSAMPSWCAILLCSCPTSRTTHILLLICHAVCLVLALLIATVFVLAEDAQPPEAIVDDLMAMRGPAFHDSTEHH